MKIWSENRNNTLSWAAECVLWKYKQEMFSCYKSQGKFSKNMDFVFKTLFHKVYIL